MSPHPHPAPLLAALRRRTIAAPVTSMRRRLGADRSPTPPAEDQGAGRWLTLARRMLVTMAGALVILAGVVMIVTPGPGLVTIAAGLAILATEYDWARRALHHVRARSRVAYAQTKARIQGRVPQRGDVSDSAGHAHPFRR